MATVGRRMRVFIEQDDGQVIEVTGHVGNLEMSQTVGNVYDYPDGRPYAYGTTVTLTLVGANTKIFDGLGFTERLHASRYADEWQCDFCGHVNPRRARYCGELDKHTAGCNAHRSFIYDE